MRQKEQIFTYIDKGFILVDATRDKFGKMNYQELQACFMPNELCL